MKPYPVIRVERGAQSLFTPRSRNKLVHYISQSKHLAETVKYILKKGVKAILLVSHRGDPDGHEVETLSLEPVKPILEALLDQVRL